MEYQMKLRSLCATGLVACVAIVSACGGSGSESTSPATSQTIAAATPAVNSESQRVEFDFDFSAVLTKEIDPALQDDFTGGPANLITGTMHWTVNLDKGDLTNVESLKTLQLSPDSYQFDLVLTENEFQYTGATVYTIADGQQDMIPMTIRPVLGGGVVDVALVADLQDFKFNYSAAELSSAGITNPSIGISIDGGVEQIFSLDPATGLSENMSLNLAAGDYTFALRLFDGNLQLGKSDPAQGAITVSPGFDVSMDIFPLAGELAMSLTVEGGDAIIDVTVPQEVVDEAGDLNNLLAVLSVVGPENDLQEVVLGLSDSGGLYSAQANLTNMNYGDVTFEMEFTKISENRALGNCIDSGTLSTTPVVVDCQLTLQRLSAVTGSIMSSLGLNVFGVDGVPVSGAIVSVDGNDVAITNSATFSSPGYAKLYLKPGDHTIIASSGAQFGSTDYTATALAVDNLDIVLSQEMFLADGFDGSESGLLAPTDYWFGCNVSGFNGPQGEINNGSLFVGTRNVDQLLDACPATYAVTELDFTDPVITDAGGFTLTANIESVGVEGTVHLAVGAEVGTDPDTYDPSATMDAVVSVSDNEIVIAIFDNGALVGETPLSMSYLLDEVSSITVNVDTISFAAGESGWIEAFVNGDQATKTSRIAFDWDGGNNHIVLGGSAGNGASGIHYIEIGSIEITPPQ